MGHVTVIAELGSSPAPEWRFEPWCVAAALAGADAVKVQLFRAEHFPKGEQAAKRRLEFPRERLAEYVRCAHAYGLTAGASVFDDQAVTLAAEWCDWLKLAARELGNAPLIRAAQHTGKTVYRSTPCRWRGPLKPISIMLGVVPSYPAGMVRSCLEAILFYRWFKSNDVPRWGWSSHTRGTLDCVLAARLGASVIEKHLALSPANLEAGHSLQPAAFAGLCRAIRKGEKSCYSSKPC